MAEENKNPWNEKWQAQMDRAHSELLELNALRETLEHMLSQVNLNLRVQIAFMELIDSQLKPPE